MRIKIIIAAISLLLLSSEASFASENPNPYPVTNSFIRDVQQNFAAPNPPGANNWQCKPSAAHPRPVVLVHGSFLNQTLNWPSMSASLANAGYCVFALTHGVAPELKNFPLKIGGMGELSASAVELKTFVNRVIRRTGAKKVDLVGHSSGAVIPIWYLKFLGGNKKVANYVGLAPSLHGMGYGFIDKLPIFPFIPDVSQLVPLCKVCLQDFVFSDFMKKLAVGGYAMPGVKYTNILSQTDGIVMPASNATIPEPEFNNIIIQNRCRLDFTDHYQMVADPNVINLVLDTLTDQARPAWGCKMVLPGLGLASFKPAS